MEKEFSDITAKVDELKVMLAESSLVTDDTNVLLKLHGLPEDTHEVLVLLHTYSKHSLIQANSRHVEMDTRLLSIMEKVDGILKHTHRLTVAKKVGFFSMRNLKYFIYVFLGLFTFVWISYMIDKEATSFVINLFREALAGTKEYILKKI